MTATSVQPQQSKATLYGSFLLSAWGACEQHDLVS